MVKFSNRSNDKEFRKTDSGLRAKEKRLKKDAGRNLWSISDSLLVNSTSTSISNTNTPVCMNGSHLFSTGSNDLDKHSTQYCGDTSVTLDDSTSGDEYLSKDEFQRSGLSKSTIYYMLRLFSSY
ncbi:unnamed protein product [Trichobilharzia regenti]|nr:unnamed protein product [Trichobilharzia regenti]